MPKSLRELQQALANKRSEYETAKQENRSLEELRTLAEEAKALNEQIAIESDMRSLDFPVEGKPVEVPTVERGFSDMTTDELDKEYTGAFLRAVRGQRVTKRDEDLLVYMREQSLPGASPYLQSSVDENGGLLIPKDIQTKINEYRRAGEYELQKIVSTEFTSFTAGERVFEKLASIVPFAPISEWDKIEDVPAPQFEKKSYQMKDYAGILPLPRRMLQDTDTNLIEHIAKFIARKHVITRNSVIITALKTLVKKPAVAYVDDLKNILNVSLDPVFAGGAKIVTNQDGYNWLDKCKDEKGNYLMQKDVTTSTGYTFLGKEVIVIPNRTLASNDGVAPVFVGSLEDAVTLFDRGLYEITETEVGGKAFERNSHDIRVIDRFDVQLWDSEAVHYTEIDTKVAPALPSTAKKSV